MQKKIVIITLWSEVAISHSKQIKKLFEDKVEIKTYSYDIDTINSMIQADLIVVSLYSIYIGIKKYIINTTKVVVLNPTITIEQYNKIMNIDEGEKVMVVNYSSYMTMETIALFNNLGINHIEFVPVYPGVSNIPKINIAVTPGESQCVPSFVKEIIDIGHRVLDVSTIVDIAVKLKLDYLLQEEKFVEHFRSLKTQSSGFEALLGKTNTLESELESLLNILDDGIIGVDASGLIHAFNKRAEKIIGYKKEEVIGKNINCIIPQIPFDTVLNTGKSIKTTLVKVNEVDISTTIVPVLVSKKITGALAMINEFTEQEKNQHKLRIQLIGKGHKAKYKFDDIHGESTQIIELKDMAKKMAKSDSSVLINGESGTGKELFAQAIHNSSKRKDYQFVAVNCAALPESLLESELFGYEEGAFTGARKGGKVGLFELAHKGTLFLDEIGEMNLSLQARLLRVIQEREVMRIGGDRVIKIDIRIIAATNKNLKKLVNEEKFRKDLYYRLNVLPLKTIPLRHRKQDLCLLVDKIKDELGVEFKLTKEAIEVFENHSWEGNIRELKNCIEYLAYLEKKVIEKNDISFIKNEFEETMSLNDIDNNIDNDIAKKLIMDCKYSPEKYIFILECLEEYLKNKKRIGRRSIVELANEKEIFLSENEVRGILNTLKDYKMVNLYNGRGGTQITELGIKVLKSIKNVC